MRSDLNDYGNFTDFGQWDGSSYAGHDKLRAGYWVYVYPRWYVWAEKDALSAEDLKKFSVDGRYSVLLRKIEAKEDRERYPDFHNFGFWAGNSYRGQEDLPPGYWVYAYPNWYIWGISKDASDRPGKHGQDDLFPLMNGYDLNRDGSASLSGARITDKPVGESKSTSQSIDALLAIQQAQVHSRLKARNDVVRSNNASEDKELKKASVDGKYSRLIKRIEVQDDRNVYTEFRDYGIL